MSNIMYLDDAREGEVLLSASQEVKSLFALIDQAEKALEGLRFMTAVAQAGIPLSDTHADTLIDRFDLAATSIETQWAKVVVALRWGTP